MLLKLAGCAPSQSVVQKFAGKTPEPEIAPPQTSDRLDITSGSVPLSNINIDSMTVSKPEGVHEYTGCRLQGNGFASRPLPVCQGNFPKAGYSARPGRTSVAPSILSDDQSGIKQDIPLSTGGAEDCAMFFFYNDEKQTQGFLHFTHNQPGIEDLMPDQIDRMPKGFNRVVVVPGSNPDTLGSIKLGLKSISTYLKDSPRDIQVEFKHVDYQPIKQSMGSQQNPDIHAFKELPEVVSYNGTVYSVLPEQKSNQFGSLFQWLDNNQVDNWF